MRYPFDPTESLLWMLGLYGKTVVIVTVVVFVVAIIIELFKGR